MTMKKKAFVLLSGGLDSTTCLALAIAEYENVEAVSVDYGQRHIKETDCAKNICDHYGVDHSVLDLRGIMSGPQVMLTDKTVEVPNTTYDQIKGVSPTYVPFRNGTMLAALTAHAQKYVMSEIAREVENAAAEGMQSTDFWKEFFTDQARNLVGIYFGAHAEDAHNWAYPDCTPEFIGAMANAIYIGSYFAIRLHTPFAYSSKADIVAKGTNLHVPYKLTWSCYKGEQYHCGTCPTCRARHDAFMAADVPDPTLYSTYPGSDPIAAMEFESPENTI